MAKKKRASYISFIAEYDDGTKHRFSIPEHVIYKSDGVALIVAYERQTKGQMPLGNIKTVKRAPLD